MSESWTFNVINLNDHINPGAEERAKQVKLPMRPLKGFKVCDIWVVFLRMNNGVFAREEKVFLSRGRNTKHRY